MSSSIIYYPNYAYFLYLHLKVIFNNIMFNNIKGIPLVINRLFAQISFFKVLVVHNYVLITNGPKKENKDLQGGQKLPEIWCMKLFGNNLKKIACTALKVSILNKMLQTELKSI